MNSYKSLSIDFNYMKSYNSNKKFQIFKTTATKILKESS